jgi:hypothetical protein
MVRVIPFKLSQQGVQSNICWVLAHSCLAKWVTALEIAIVVARVCRASVMFVHKIEYESHYSLCSHASIITGMILRFS